MLPQMASGGRLPVRRAEGRADESCCRRGYRTVEISVTEEDGPAYARVHPSDHNSSTSGNGEPPQGSPGSEKMTERGPSGPLEPVEVGPTEGWMS